MIEVALNSVKPSNALVPLIVHKRLLHYGLPSVNMHAPVLPVFVRRRPL